MAETSSPRKSQRSFVSRLLWPGIIFVMLGGQLLLMALMTYMANSDSSFAVEPDYYQKGLHWDATLAQRNENKRLGWSASLEIGDAAASSNVLRLACRLADKSGQPLDDATVDLVAFSHLRGSDRLTATLLPVDDGRYQADVRLDEQGTWEFRLVVQRGSDTFTDTQLLEVYPAGEGEPWRP